MKIINGVRTGKPETLPIYHDSVQITEDGNFLYQGPFSTEPDPTRPPPHTDIGWATFGARIAEGSYMGVVMDATLIPGYKEKNWTKYIYLYNLEGEISIPTINPDPNNNGLYVVRGVLIHPGWSDDWPGTIACQSMPKSNAAAFFKVFTIGEHVQYNLRK